MLDGIYERRPRGPPLFCWVFDPLRAKTPEDRQILELLDPVAEACGYAIVRLRLMGGDRSGRTLQIMAERPSDGDMGIDDCTTLSRACAQVLDAVDPINGEYRFEVSSPGIDRPLTRLKDFVDYEGYEARLELDRVAEGRKRFRGVLAGVEDDNIAIDQEDEEETTLIPFAWITEAKLSLNDKLLQKGAEARAARLAAEAAETTEDEETD